jgi:hypothetical protein
LVVGGFLAVIGTYIAVMNWLYPPEKCDPLMRAFQNNTKNEIVLDRLNAECPGWESNS